MFRKRKAKAAKKKSELLDSREELTLGAIAAAVPFLALWASI